MTENELHAFVKELQENTVELMNFVCINAEHLSESEIDELVEEFEGNYLGLREFVINALED